jgi:methylated-DNA-protein-cysteine methyltransferase related protein
LRRSEFFDNVYRIVAKIPAGKVMTYGQIAVILGEPHGARRVGQAMYNTPEYLDIPAHRVVNSKGMLAPAYVFGGIGKQREILEREGVLFKQNDCVNLKKSILNYSKTW